MDDVLVLALVLLLVGSGYAAGRVHAEIGYRLGFRSGYRQGHADGSRRRPSPGGRDSQSPPLELHVTGSGDHGASERRQYGAVVGSTVHTVRHARG